MQCRPHVLRVCVCVCARLKVPLGRRFIGGKKRTAEAAAALALAIRSQVARVKLLPSFYSFLCRARGTAAKLNKAEEIQHETGQDTQSVSQSVSQSVLHLSFSCHPRPGWSHPMTQTQLATDSLFAYMYCIATVSLKSTCV